MKKVSDRGRLRKEIGRLHKLILLEQRGYVDEICGERSNNPDDFARFHILTVASMPKLEFRNENVLLYLKSHWWVCHEPYHHDRDGKLGQKIMKRIIELRGENYKQELRFIAQYIGRMNGLYLLALKDAFKKEIGELRG